jgi:hypothetical protein
MAGLLLHVSSGEVALANGKTMLQIVAAANDRLRVQGWGAAIKGTSATDPPVLWQVVRQTTAGTMSAGTVSKKNDADPETVQTTALVNATVEPTTGAIVESFEIHPQTGYRVFYPMGQEIMIPNGERLGWKATSSTLNYNAVTEVDLEE